MNLSYQLFPLRRAEALTLGTHIVESMVDTPQGGSASLSNDA